MNEYIIKILLLIAGMIGGFLNAMVSSGSAITLPFMIFLGIPPSIANATNRIPCMVGFVSSTINFHRAKLIDWRKVFILSVPLIIGTITGVLLVSKLNDNSVKYILIGALFFSLILALTKFKKLTLKETNKSKPITLLTLLIFLLIGVWAGVIVLDTATFILFALTLNLGIDLLKSNAIKSAVCLIILITSSIIFYVEGQIDWGIGIILSIGSFVGGYLGSKLAISDNSRVWLFRILISVLLLEIITMAFNDIFK
jgi:uncharacterized membrane protein YfcA